MNTPAEKLMEYIKFLVDNVYISVGNRIYKQTVGIPMGTDCAPMLANLFLFSYEYAYTKEMLKTDYGTALAMRHTVRYIDDLLTFNNPTFNPFMVKFSQRIKKYATTFTYYFYPGALKA